ncbi:MAG: endolytic transglycosylase MltG [Sphaerochaetaceae bacterium]
MSKMEGKQLEFDFMKDKKSEPLGVHVKLTKKNLVVPKNPERRKVSVASRSVSVTLGEKRKKPVATPQNKKKPAKKRQPAFKVKKKKEGVPKKKATAEPPELGTRTGYRTSLPARFSTMAILLATGLCVLALLVVSISKGRKTREKVTPPVDSISSVVVFPQTSVSIKAGMTARQVAMLLEKEGVVKNAQEFLEYLVSHNLASSLRMGDYLLDKQGDFDTLARSLTGQGPVLSVIVSNGKTLKQVDEYLVQRGYAKEGDFLQAVNSLADSYGLDFSEGWFASGSYEVSHLDTANDLAMQMYRRMLEYLSPLLTESVVKEYGVDTLLIVASLIQAETQNSEEMPLIAGIIYNRLKDGIPLGIDATTRYETGDWTHEIASQVFETMTPYNTRRKIGLPPSGICCPSALALQSAAKPLKTEYVFYLHGKDGRLHPAKDYAEHQKNIERYL